MNFPNLWITFHHPLKRWLIHGNLSRHHPKNPTVVSKFHNIISRRQQVVKSSTLKGKALMKPSWKRYAHQENIHPGRPCPPATCHTRRPPPAMFCCVRFSSVCVAVCFCDRTQKTTTTTTRNKQSLRPRPFSLFLPYSTNKDCGPVSCSDPPPLQQPFCKQRLWPLVLFWPPPPWNNQSATPFLCFFLFLQTKTVAPSVVLTPPPPPTTLLQTKTVAPCVVLTPPPSTTLLQKQLTRWCWIENHSQDDVE